MEMLEREEALARLNEAFDRICEGSGRVVAISGEAGAGKTTLVNNFSAQSASRMHVHVGACENLVTPEPLLPLRDIVRASGGQFQIDPDRDHLSLFEALLDFLADDAPALLVLEDVHWADAATVDLVRFLCRRVARLKALVLITFRDEEVGQRAPLRQALGEAPNGRMERLVLPPLSLAAVSQLAAHHDQSGEDVFALTGGNPFLVTETLAVGGDAPSDAVRDATLARAMRLSPEGQAVLETVSIFPRSANRALVADLIGTDFDAGLDACIERGMLALDRESLKFRHEIARRAIERSLPPAARRRLHQRVVDALRIRPGVRASEGAHHAERAGDDTALVGFARRAGKFAARAGAHQEAAAHYASILRRRSILSSEDLAETLEHHAEQSHLSGTLDAAVDSMAEAADLRRAAEDHLRLGRDLTRLSRYAWTDGRRVEADRAIEEAIIVLSSMPAGEDLARAYSFRSQLDMVALNLDSALVWGERAVALAEQLDNQEILAHALANVGTALFKRDTERSQRAIDRSLEISLAAGYHDHALRAWILMTYGHYWGGENDGALAHIEAGAAYAAERDLSHWEAHLRGLRAMIYIDRGAWNEAARDAEEICGWARVTGIFRFSGLVALARLRIRRGEPDFEEPLEDARRLVQALGELQHSMYIAILDAECAYLGNVSEACVAERLRDQHALAIEANAPWFVSESAIWLNELGESVPDCDDLPAPFAQHCLGQWSDAARDWRAAGRPYEEALALSAGDEMGQRQALAIFDRLGAEPAARRLRQKMRAAGIQAIPRGPSPGTRAHPAGLTRRQAQVLNLISDGLSNPEIADRLYISAKTAEHHVSAVMARLDVATRQEAAAVARKRGLLEPGDYF